MKVHKNSNAGNDAQLLKDNGIRLQDAIDVNAVMRDMMSVLLEGVLDEDSVEDILRDDFLYTYFLTEVCDQDPKYTRTHDQPYATLYEQ